MSVLKRVIVALVSPLIFGLSAADAQVKADDIAVAAVSIKLSHESRATWYCTQDSVRISGASLSNLILLANGMNDVRQVEGLPKTLETYDIEIKVEESDLPKFKNLPLLQKYFLLRPVLIERFGIKSHQETKSFPGLALVVTKDGPKMALTTLKPTDTPPSVWKITGRYQLEAKNISMDMLCRMLLSGETRETAVDQTNLHGGYDFTLSWTREQDQTAAGEYPEIFASLKQQLGLQLVSRQIPEKVVVVDSIHSASQN